MVSTLIHSFFYYRHSFNTQSITAVLLWCWLSSKLTALNDDCLTFSNTSSFSPSSFIFSPQKPFFSCVPLGFPCEDSRPQGDRSRKKWFKMKCPISRKKDDHKHILIFTINYLEVSMKKE